MLPDVFLDQLFEESVPRRAQGAAVQEDLSQGSRLVGDLGVEGPQQTVAVNESVLQRQQAEEQALGRGDRTFGRG